MSFNGTFANAYWVHAEAGKETAAKGIYTFGNPMITEFDAEDVTKDGFTLTWSSNEQCVSNSSKKLHILMKAACSDSSLKPNGVLYFNDMKPIDGECTWEVNYAGPEACRMFSANLTAFLAFLYPLIGVVAVFCGLALAFFGARFLFQLVALCFASFLTLAFFGAGFSSFLPRDKTWAVLLYLFLCSVAAGYISFHCYGFAKTWAVSLIAAWGGLAFALTVAKMVGIQMASLVMLTAVAGSAAGAYFGKKYNILVRCVCTAALGSYLAVKGLNAYYGGIPENLMSGSADVTEIELDWRFYVYIITALALFINGNYYQLRTMKTKRDDDYNYKPDKTHFF